jgi:hypothetical protein
MPTYCSDSTTAVATYRFPDRRQKLFTCERPPLKATIRGIPNEELADYRFPSVIGDYLAIDIPNVDTTYDNGDPNSVTWLSSISGRGFDYVSVGTITLQTNWIYGFIQTVTLPSPIWLPNGSQVFGHGVEPYKRLILYGGGYATDMYELQFEDAIGRKLKVSGRGYPSLEVRCGGCGANQLDCGGCCADCTGMLAIAKQMNFKLAG